MLHLYRRHLESCAHRSMDYRRCRCPVWVFGSLDGKRVRRSLDTVSWERGEEMLRELDPQDIVEAVSVADACDRFEADCKARHLGPAQLGKYRLLSQELKREFGARSVRSISVDDLRLYRETWRVASVTAHKKLERLRTFFRFCYDSGWTRKNPASVLKAPKEKLRQVLPFTREEVEKIFWAIDLYPDRPRGRRSQLRRFVLLLRYTGMRISDVVQFESANLVDGKIVKATRKTGATVVIPIPEHVAAEIKPIPGERFPFWSGNGELKGAVADWQRSLKRLFALAGVKGHAHRFRHTFSVELLTHGVSLENVARLLGNSAKIVEKHYAAWVKQRQDALQTEVEKVWKS